MADRIQKLTLAHPVFTPADIKFAEYTPQQEDMSLLANSLARMEERKRTANEKISAMDVAFGKMKSELHQDEETLKWFDNYAKNYKNQVNAFAQLGDYGNAINSAVRLAGEAASSGELAARIKTNQQYEQKVKEIQALADNGTITQTTRDRWIAQNQYSFTPITNEQGEVIGGKDWTAKNSTPVKHYAVSDIQKIAFSMTPEELGVTERRSHGSVLGTLDGTTVKNISDAEVVLGQTESSSYNQYNRKLEANLKGTLEELMKNHPEFRESIKQDYDDSVWLYEEALRKSKDISLSEEERAKAAKDAEIYKAPISDANGNIIDSDDYELQTVYPMMKHMSYNNIVSKSGGGTNYNESALGAIHQTSVNKALAAIDLMDMTTTPGAPVSMNYGNWFSSYNWSTNMFNNAIGGIYAQEANSLYKSGRINRSQYFQMIGRNPQ